MVTAEQREPIYAMGYSEEERQRLIDQAVVLEDTTRRLFLDAGLAPGMRVLDVGCGVGDVAFLAASIVGDEGEVVGVDADPRALTLARARAVSQGLTNVEFVQADLREYTADRPFDALVGRLILLYLGDPAGALRHMAEQLHPGGIVAFQDFQLDVVHYCHPPLPTVDQTFGWVVPAFQRAGAETSMGLKLYDAFVQAGLPGPRLHMDVHFVTPTDDRWIVMLSQVIRSILPLMERFGVARADEVDIETWAQRHRDAVAATGAVHTTPPVVRAWTRTPRG